VAAPIRTGTCSFADEALTKVFYPPGVRTGAARLAHYATVFDTVEIDSTFYRLQPPETVEKWADAVPDGFVFHVKAFAPMTRHGVKHEVLPEPLATMLAADDRGRVERMPREARAVAFQLFREMVEPLREAGQLGSILLQLAPYVVVKPASFEYLEWARDQLDGYDVQVEFRHRSWFDEDNRAHTLSFLEEHGLGNVIVDAPRSEAKNLIPTVVALTSPTAYLRFHGRNAKTWNVRGGSAADRFDYLYPEGELEEWVEPMKKVAKEAEQAYALMNTNAYGPRPDDPEHLVAQGPENALALARVLHAAGVPATP
jgi:uncharacterized protein YecE (DUF72 family)